MSCTFAAADAFVAGRDFRSPLNTTAKWRDVVACDDFGNVRWFVEGLGLVADRRALGHGAVTVLLDDRQHRTRAIQGRLNAVLEHYGQPVIKSTDYRWHRAGVGPWPGSTKFTIAGEKQP